jgi:hypothetical protein
MKRLIAGLNQASGTDEERIPDGVYLVRVQRAQYRWHATKPFYALRFGVLAPKNYVGCAITARLYCTPKALWKLNWFCATSATTRNCWRETRSRTGTSWGSVAW